MIEFTYRNHHGAQELRKVEPLGLEFLRHPGFGYQPGWFLRAFCLDRKKERSFALSHIVLPETPGAPATFGLSFLWGKAPPQAAEPFS